MDEGLILRIAVDDRQALETLYRETSTSVYGFVLSIVRNSHIAEDIMQETYLKIYTSAKGYRPQGKPLAWMLTIAHNLSLMKLREKEASNISLEPDWGAARTDGGHEKTLDRMVLETAMQILSDEERQIIILHDVSGMKHREIADIMSIPLPTVLSKYRRALSKLRKQIKGETR